MTTRLERAIAGVRGLFALVTRWAPVSTRVSQSSRTLASVLVTPDTAVTIPAVWACLRYISQTVAYLPWHVMLDGKSGAEIQSSHPIDYLLNTRPSAEWSAFQFKETLTHWALRWGNGIAEIEFDQVGRPSALWPIHPERVDPRRRDSGALYYLIDGKTELEPSEVFHVRGFGEGPWGVNVITYAAETLGWARAAQLFGAAFFGNGMNVSGVLKTKAGKDQLKIIRAEIDSLYKGVRRSNKVALIDADDEFTPIAVEPEKAQFILTNQHLVEEVCRIFGVPPHKIMHLLRATFSNIEHQAIEVVVDCITPWVKRFEDEANFKLFGQNRPNFYTKMNMRALLRGDNAGRATFYKQMFDMGAYSPNRILELEDENTLGKIGDKHLVQLNLTTLDKAGEQPAAPAPKPQPQPMKDEPPANVMTDLIQMHGKYVQA